MKKTFILFLVLLIGASSFPSAKADLTYDIMPLSGLSTQSIFISVRDKPIIGDYKQYMYAFIDGVMVVDRALCVDQKDGTYMYLWDKTIPIPKAVNGYGRHLITVWVETEYGLRNTHHAYYTITDGLPDTVESWLEMLEDHPEILVQLRGPQGDAGAPGAAGGAGARGAKGEQGDSGVVDYAQLWATVPPDVLILMRGEQGVRGLQGEAASPVVIGIGCVVSVIASCVFTWYYAQRKEVG